MFFLGRNKKHTSLLAVLLLVLFCLPADEAFSSENDKGYVSVSEKTEHTLMDADLREAYNEASEKMEKAATLAATSEGRLHERDGKAREKMHLDRPFIVNIGRDSSGAAKYEIISAPLDSVLTEKVDFAGPSETFHFKLTKDKHNLFIPLIGGKDTGSFRMEHRGKTMYETMLDLPLTSYVLGNLTYRTEDFFSKIGSMKDATAKKIMGEIRDMYGGSGGLDERLKQGQDVFTEQLMKNVPLGILFFMMVIQLALNMYGGVAKDSGGMADWSSVLMRYFVYNVAILAYPLYIAFTIDFFSAITALLVPPETQSYIINSIIGSASMWDEGASSSSFTAWLVDFIGYLGYLAVQILMIMRDVFLSISVLFGPIIFAVSFPSTAEGNKAADFSRQMLSGWIEGFTRMMLWAPIGAACIVLLGFTTVLSAIGAQSVIARVVMAVSMMFACTKVPDLAEKMSGQGLTAVFGMLGGAVTSAGGSALGGSVVLAGGGLTTLVSMVGRSGKGNALSKGLQKASAVERIGRGTGEVMQGVGRGMNSEMRDAVRESAAQQQTDNAPHIRFEDRGRPT